MNSEVSKNSAFGKAPLILWSVTTLYFAFQFILRSSVGILREDIMQRFGVSADVFGELAGYYYLGYAGLQIPLGYLLDRYNFRVVIAFFISLTACGSFIFAYSDNWSYLLFARVLIGAGSAAGFLGVAKVINSYFDKEQHSLLLGFAFTFGLLGAIVGGKPTRIAFDHYGYEFTFMSLVAIAFLIALIVLFASPRNAIENAMGAYKNKSSFDTLIKSFRLILNPTMLFIGVSGGLMVGSLEGFTDMWAMPYLSQIYGFSRDDGILLASVVYFGMCIGGPLLAAMAEWIKSVNVMIFLTGICTCFVFAVLFYTKLNYAFTFALMFFLGILCCYQVLVFSLVGSIVSAELYSIAIAVTNCINMAFGHLFHMLISKRLHAYWNHATDANGIPVYDLYTFVESLFVVPELCLVGTFGFLYLAYRQRVGKLKMIDLS